MLSWQAGKAAESPLLAFRNSDLKKAFLQEYPAKMLHKWSLELPLTKGKGLIMCLDPNICPSFAEKWQDSNLSLDSSKLFFPHPISSRVQIIA